MAQNKVLFSVMAAAGVVLLLVIGYRMGQRQAQAPMPAGTPQAGSPMMQGTPNTGAGSGPGHRRLQATGQADSGNQDVQRGKGQRGGRSSDKGGGGSNQARSIQVQEGTLGSEKIAVIAAGKESSFTGTDLKGLHQTMVASARGARKGWAAVEVMKHLGITKGKELVLVNKDGKSLSIPWEKLTNKETAVILTYNKMGGLMLTSGVEMTTEQLQTADNRGVKTAAKRDENSLFLSSIVKIEVKT